MITCDDIRLRFGLDLNFSSEEKSALALWSAMCRDEKYGSCWGMYILPSCDSGDWQWSVESYKERDSEGGFEETFALAVRAAACKIIEYEKGGE